MRGRARELGAQPAPELQALDGQGIELRLPGLGDAAAVFAYTSDPRASRYLGWQPHRAVGETREFLASCAEGWRGGRRLRWLIHRRSGGVVGMIEAQLSRTMAGVGYVIAPQHWGCGYASEALSLVVGALFDYTSVSAIWAVCEVENRASARVLEKGGFLLAHYLPDYRACPNLGPQKRDFESYVCRREGISRNRRG